MLILILELRTPLGVITNIFSSLKDEKLTVRQKDLIKIGSHTSDSLLHIINNILNAAKSEEYEISLVNNPFYLLDLFENTIELFIESAGCAPDVIHPGTSFQSSSRNCL